MYKNIRNGNKKRIFDWYQSKRDALAQYSGLAVARAFINKYGDLNLSEKYIHDIIKDIRRGAITEQSFKRPIEDAMMDIPGEVVPEIKPKIYQEHDEEIQPNFDTSFFDNGLIEFPVSWAESSSPVVIKGISRLGVCGDLHLPYHDSLALAACFAEFKRRNVDGIYINGDGADFFKISRFHKEPSNKMFKDEIDVMISFLRSLRKMFPNIKIYYKSGNHEMRLEKYIIEKCPELYNLYGVSIQDQLKLNELGIEYVPEHIVARYGKLWIAHGSELGMGSGSVNVARQIRLRVGVNIMTGHFHRTQVDQGRNLEGVIHAAWALGCLCHLQARYTGAVNQWGQAGATVDMLDEEGNFKVDVFNIINGRVY